MFDVNFFYCILSIQFECCGGNNYTDWVFVQNLRSSPLKLPDTFNPFVEVNDIMDDEYAKIIVTHKIDLIRLGFEYQLAKNTTKDIALPTTCCKFETMNCSTDSENLKKEVEIIFFIFLLE